MRIRGLVLGVVLSVAFCLTASAVSLPLRTGSTGDDVKTIQEKLINLRYLSDTADGIFGKKTEEAVKAFQKDKKLEATGVVDEQTLDLLVNNDENTNSDQSETKKKVKAGEYYYSTNDKEKVRKGKEGVYAYKTKGGTYRNFIIADLDEGYVYSFSEGNGNDICERVKIDSGDLNSVLVVSYHDGEDIWQEGMHFKYKNQPDHLVHEDWYGFETDFYPTDLLDALEIKDKKTIHDY